MERFLLLLRTVAARILALPPVTRILGALALVLLIVALIFWRLFISAPSAFPTDRLIDIPEGVAASTLAHALEEVEVVRSSFLFHAWMRVTGADREIHAGSYYFARPLNLFEVAARINEGERGIDSIRITLTEGMTSWEMGEALGAALPEFSAETFATIARPFEGYLFPDTYFIDPGTTPEMVLERLRQTFAEKTAALREGAPSTRPFEDYVIMASLIEKEADTALDRRIVAGILWNRIENEMPLQVDAVFGYILTRSGYAPTGADLDIDSPYNTYENRGLPPGAISNPGLDALHAALTPTPTEYFYYLTGRDGKMYYARTFEEHKQNRELYLD